MQLQRRSSSSARSIKSFVSAKKNKVVSAVSKILVTGNRSNPPTPSSVAPLLPQTDDDVDFEDDLPYPTRRDLDQVRPPSSVLTASTRSTTGTSLFSRQSFQTTGTTPEHPHDIIKIDNRRPSFEPAEAFATPAVSDDERDAGSSSDEDEDEEPLHICAKRETKPFPTTFASSLPPPNPHRAFLAHPLYKKPYVFPVTYQPLILGSE
ncbi:hypothetical protein FRB90_009615 [Tulasnella sp. 427]|nr:hypothetical protein FRB90_009615 [Tulasnella sp. 427]